jgi:hypothetical protein
LEIFVAFHVGFFLGARFNIDNFIGDVTSDDNDNGSSLGNFDGRIADDDRDSIGFGSV